MAYIRDDNNIAREITKGKIGIKNQAYPIYKAYVGIEGKSVEFFKSNELMLVTFMIGDNIIDDNATVTYQIYNKKIQEECFEEIIVTKDKPVIRAFSKDITVECLSSLSQVLDTSIDFQSQEFKTNQCYIYVGRYEAMGLEEVNHIFKISEEEPVKEFLVTVENISSSDYGKQVGAYITLGKPIWDETGYYLTNELNIGENYIKEGNFLSFMTAFGSDLQVNNGGVYLNDVWVGLSNETPFYEYWLTDSLKSNHINIEISCSDEEAKAQINIYTNEEITE